MPVRLSIPVEVDMWRRLRDLAEHDRLPGGRASVAHVVVKLIARELAAPRLSAGNTEAGKA